MAVLEGAAVSYERSIPVNVLHSVNTPAPPLSPYPTCSYSGHFFTLVTGPRRFLSLKLSDTKVYEPYIRARLGKPQHNTTPDRVELAVFLLLFLELRKRRRRIRYGFLSDGFLSLKWQGDHIRPPESRRPLCVGYSRSV